MSTRQFPSELRLLHSRGATQTTKRDEHMHQRQPNGHGVKGKPDQRIAGRGEFGME